MSTRLEKNSHKVFKISRNPYRIDQTFYQRASDLTMCSHNKLIHAITLYDQLKN